MPRTKEKVVILGSGWAGFRLIRELNKDKYDVSVVSPRNHFVFTPLLASTAVGTLEYRCITEPVRSSSNDIQYYQAFCDRIDDSNQTIHCVSSIEGESIKKDFYIKYDILIITVGAHPNTFGIPGVKEYAHFLKEVKDAKSIRKQILNCFEYVSQPGLSLKETKDKLHFVVVGGGPTGVEFSAELNDFISSDLSKLYPNLIQHVRMSLYDVGPKILSAFDSDLSGYASRKFKQKGIEIKTEREVEKVEKDYLVIKNEGKVPYGLLVWSTGLTKNPLVEAFISAAKDESDQKILTDGFLRVINKKTNACFTNIYALGDCSGIKDKKLPATAQVADQESGYLAKVLNGSASKEFEFKNKGMMAFIGSNEALIDMSSVFRWAKISGYLSWVVWRSVYLYKTVSIRNKLMVPYHWFLTFVLGRDTSSYE